MNAETLPRRVLMIDNNRLLNEAVSKVMNKYEDISVVAQTKDVSSIPQLIHQQKPDWLLLIKQADKAVPEEIRQAVDGSTVKLITFAEDGSRIELIENSAAPRQVKVENIHELVKMMIDPSSSFSEKGQAGL